MLNRTVPKLFFVREWLISAVLNINIWKKTLHYFYVHDILLNIGHQSGTPGWLSGWASAFGSERDPGVPGSSPTWSLLLPLPVSLPLSVCLS